LAYLNSTSFLMMLKQSAAFVVSILVSRFPQRLLQN
jgi:hypothetical protein